MSTRMVIMRLLRRILSGFSSREGKAFDSKALFFTPFRCLIKSINIYHNSREEYYQAQQWRNIPNEAVYLPIQK